MELSERDSIVPVGEFLEVLRQNVGEELACAIRDQIREDDEDRLVARVVAADRLGLQQQLLIVLDELDDVRQAAARDSLRSKPQRLAFAGSGNEGTDRPGAAQVRIGLRDESLDPVCDSTQRIQILLCKTARQARVFEILQQEEIGGLCCHDAHRGA